MAYDKLVLHPVDPWAILHDPTLLREALREQGLIARSFSSDGELHYEPGPRFGRLVRFRGLAEQDWTSFHVSLSETAEEPVFLGAAHAHPPPCPRCRAKLTDWRAQLQAWQRERHRRTWRCSSCVQPIEVCELDWTHTGGFARYSLDIWGIRPNAATPSNELLSLLERVTFQAWNYLYHRLGSDGPQSFSRLHP